MVQSCKRWSASAFLGLVLAWGVSVSAVEEELSLDKITEQATPVVIPRTSDSKFTLMGRLDLTLEMNPVEGQAADNKTELKNWHGLRVFLKLKASPKTSFFGEIANQDFYHIDYHALANHTFSFGKILVPFGDTRFFHHFYGGIQGKGPQGMMFPNIWAETGANWQARWSDDVSSDVYVVDGIEAPSAREFPDTHNSADASRRQALGSRIQWQGIERLTVLGSAYFDYYYESRPLNLLGLDIYSDYGFMPLPLRFAAGIANAGAEKIPEKGVLHRRGDYMMIAGLGLGPGEWRVRYGTYNQTTKEKSENDTHSLEASYLWHMDVIRFLLQRQWNFEAFNEKDDDLWRLMVSVDF